MDMKIWINWACERIALKPAISWWGCESQFVIVKEKLTRWLNRTRLHRIWAKYSCQLMNKFNSKWWVMEDSEHSSCFLDHLLVIYMNLTGFHSNSLISSIFFWHFILTFTSHRLLVGGITFYPHVPSLSWRMLRDSRDSCTKPANDIHFMYHESCLDRRSACRSIWM